jgi:hypothetical protein
MVHPDHLSLLFTAIAVFEGISTIDASPLLGLSFSVGLGIGGIAVSQPFFIAAILYALAAVVMFTGMSIGSDVLDSQTLVSFLNTRQIMSFGSANRKL